MNNLHLKLFIIVLNFNGENLTVDCLESLKGIECKKNCKVTTVVVDNNSQGGSLKIIKKMFPQVLLIYNKKNLGWSGGNNVGIKYALRHRADCVLLLNNDVLIAERSVEHLLEVLYSKLEIGIVGPKSYYSEKKKIIADAGGVIKKHRFFGINRGNDEMDIGQYDKVVPVDFVCGAAMMIKSEVFKKIGLFDDRFFLYYEDADFCQRAKKKGFDSVFVPDSIIYHSVGATGKIGSPLHNYYTTRNHLLFMEKYAPLKIRLKEVFRTPKTLLEFWLSKDKNQRYSIFAVCDYFFRRFGERKYW